VSAGLCSSLYKPNSWLPRSPSACPLSLSGFPMPTQGFVPSGL
jgi:hypothetical protein